MTDVAPAIRPFGPADLDFALEQKKREGWAVSRDQFELYLKHDPNGCFVAVDGDRPVGMVTTTCFGPSGWIGNLIVEPDRRSRGIGRALMEHGLDHLRGLGTSTVRLEGDPPGIPLYRSLGFVDEYESCRFTRAGSRETSGPEDPVIERIRTADLDEIAALDASIIGEHRRRFLALKTPAAEVAVLHRPSGSVAGYLLAAPTDRGFRIGPCVALDAADARHLIAVAISAAAGRPVLIGSPAPNAEALGMLSEMGFEKGSSSFRMRLGPALVAGDPTRIFAIASGAVG
jgi:ribosomal protein S18 acetylase RimI-like enzyme